MRADPEKIRMMTDLAIFEKNNKKNVFQVCEYYRLDYILWNVLLAFLRFTGMALIFFILYVIFRADLFFYNVNIKGITDTLKVIGSYYIAGAAVYSFISLIVYAVRYTHARKGLLLYASKLKKLARKYHYIKDSK